jgi:hypothetical protein
MMILYVQADQYDEAAAIAKYTPHAIRTTVTQRVKHTHDYLFVYR